MLNIEKLARNSEIKMNVYIKMQVHTRVCSNVCVKLYMLGFNHDKLFKSQCVIQCVYICVSIHLTITF